MKKIELMAFGMVVAASWIPVQGAALERNMISLKECEKMAVESHKSVRLARGAFDAARAKELESFRALLPSLSFKAEETRGQAQDAAAVPDFMERSYGAQISQSAFQGGRLLRTYFQARSLSDLTRAKVEKARQEAVFQARQATLRWIRARRQAEVWERAVQDLDREKERAEVLFQKDIVAPHLFMTVKIQSEEARIQYEIALAQKESALWRWSQALGLGEPPPARPDPGFKAAPETSADLAACLALARRDNPDLAIQRLTLEAARQASKAARAHFWPLLEVNGFYGRSGAAYRTEPLRFQEDWQLGARALLKFGGSSLQASGLAQRTSPKIGQSSRTQSETRSAVLGLFDQLKDRTERKETELAREEAQAQLEWAEQEIRIQVHESYAEWKKSAAQTRLAESRLALALTELSMAEIRSSHRESPLSERAQARLRAAQAEAVLAEAQCDLGLALAALNHAVGNPDQFPMEAQP